jgi:two-component system, response regulator RegA
MSAQTILLVDDDEVFRTRLRGAFERRGFEVRDASSGAAALELARSESPELALVDLRMPGLSGLDVVTGLKQIDASTNIVVLTGYGSIATALEAVRLGATHYLTKPADVSEILEAFGRTKGTEVRADALATDTPSLARAEWEHINRVLADCSGNITQAAQLLGLHRRSLQRKLAKYPVPK